MPASLGTASGMKVQFCTSNIVEEWEIEMLRRRRIKEEKD
jgi:hypothetical protein